LSGQRSQPKQQQRDVGFIEVADPEGRKRRTQELISHFQRDIARLNEEIRILEDSLSGAEFNSHKKMLLERKKTSGENFVQAEKRLKSLVHKNKTPTEKIRVLHAKQNELVGEIKALEDRLYRF